MNQIAGEIGISKKTIYASFKNKEQLLDECMKQEIEKVEIIISDTIKSSQSSLETLLLVGARVFKELAGFCPAFYKDLSRFPVAQECLMRFRLKFRDSNITYFRQCAEEGFFIPTANNDGMASIYVEEIGSLTPKHQRAMIQTLLREICTEKGIKELNRLNLTFAQTNNQI
jgi:AcrR family transcriptional regulator